MSLTTEHRPVKWSELVGQDVIVKTLKNSVKTKQLHNGYLFCGYHGTGKTTTARLLAKTLNCKDVDADFNPCNKCDSCLGINNSTSLDVKEIDMASNRGIDDIRDIQESVRYSSVNGKFRIVICDEVHQVTPQGASALLKILEEPPKNVIFILATTDPQKVLSTIRSRCQVMNFKRVDDETIAHRLTEILRMEEIGDETEEIEEMKEVCLAIAKLGDGSVRDAEAKLAILVSGGLVSKQSFKEAFGAGTENSYQAIYDFMLKGNIRGCIEYFASVEGDINNSLDWATQFADFVLQKALKDLKNFNNYQVMLDEIDSYLSKFTQNQSIVYLRLMLVKLCGKQLKFSTLEQPINKPTEYDIWDLARWFNAYQINLAEIPNVYELHVGELVIFVGEQKDILHSQITISLDKIAEIVSLPNDIDKNELIEKGLINVSD